MLGGGGGVIAVPVLIEMFDIVGISSPSCPSPLPSSWAPVTDWQSPTLPAEEPGHLPLS
jgi:hypothetical protein